MHFTINEQISQVKWNSLLDKSLFASPFQSPAFWKLFNTIPGLSAEAFAIENNHELKALCVITIQKENGVKGFFSSRGIIYGGPLIEEGNLEVFGILLQKIPLELKKEIIYIETRNLFDYSIYKDIFIRNKYRYIPYVNYKVKTENMVSMYDSMSNSRKRQIIKAQKNSVTWGEAQNPDEVKRFYEILLNLYKYKINKPLLPFEFFRNFFGSGLGKYLLIRYKNKIIGGIMCAIIKDKALYEFYVCGLDDEYKEQYPSVMATWAAMEYANQHGIPLFDFMGAGKPDEKYGVREFKARFGGELVEYGRFIKINKPLLYEIGKLGLKISKSFTE